VKGKTQYDSLRKVSFPISLYDVSFAASAELFTASSRAIHCLFYGRILPLLGQYSAQEEAKNQTTLKLKSKEALLQSQMKPTSTPNEAYFNPK